MRELTAKEINIGISKKGWGVEEFQKNYGYADIEELKVALGKVFSNTRNVNQALKSMKNNSKRNKKHNAMPQTSGDEEDLIYTSVAMDNMVASLPPHTLNVTNAIKEAGQNIKKFEESGKTEQEEDSTMFEIAKNVSNDIKPIPTDTVKETVLDSVVINVAETIKNVSSEVDESIKPAEISENENQLEVLKDKLNLINEQIMSCESSKKAMYARRRATSKTVDEICKKLKELETEVKNHKQRFEVVFSEYCENEKQLDEERARFNELQQERENVMSQIRELTALSMYCGKLDSIDMSFDYKLSEQNIENSKINEKFMSFFNNSELADSGLLDDFAVYSLKLVAKIIVVCEQIEEEESRTIELCFDEKSNTTDLLEFVGKKVKIIS